MRLLAYNVSKLITVAHATKHLMPVSLAIMVTIYHHQLLAAPHAPQSHHNAHYAVMLRHASLAIVAITWHLPPLV
jgi:hypothetical protein